MDNFTKYNKKNLLAIDYGQKVIGLALFCPGRDPFPLPAGRIINKDEDQVIKDLQSFIDEEFVEVIILGIPHLLDGTVTKMTIKMLDFGTNLKANFPTLEVVYQDETLTTFEAEDRMKKDPRYNFKVNPKEIDALSAVIILEDFIGKK